MLAWLAEGLRSDEVNSLAAEFRPPFSISKQQADYYRKTRKVDIDALKREGEGIALSTGLAISGERVKLLKRIATRLESDLFKEDLFWTLEVKGVGAGAAAEVVEYEEFKRFSKKKARKPPTRIEGYVVSEFLPLLLVNGHPFRPKTTDLPQMKRVED